MAQIERSGIRRAADRKPVRAKRNPVVERVRLQCKCAFELFMRVDKVLAHYDGDVAGRTFAIWGLSFKPGTDDMREAPAIVIIEALLEAGAKVQATDPAAMEIAEGIFGDRISYMPRNYDTLVGADALLVVTEWNEFRYPDYEQIKAAMAAPVIFDGRNILNRNRLEELGFTYYGIGV